jgi:hypothetical protein
MSSQVVTCGKLNRLSSARENKVVGFRGYNAKMRSYSNINIAVFVQTVPTRKYRGPQFNSPEIVVKQAGFNSSKNVEQLNRSATVARVVAGLFS